MQSYLLETDRLYIKVPTITSLDNWYNLQCDHQVIKYIGNGKPLNSLSAKILYFFKKWFLFFCKILKFFNFFERIKFFIIISPYIQILRRSIG